MINYKFDEFYKIKYSYVKSEVEYGYIIEKENKKVYFYCDAFVEPNADIYFGDAEDGTQIEYNNDMEFDLDAWSLYDKNDNELSLKQASQILNCSEEELNNVITKVKEDSKNVLEDDLLKNLDENADPGETLESWDWDDYYNED